MLALPFDLCPMSHRHEHIAHAWFAAFNAHDLEALLTLYAEDAEHFSPKLLVRRPETAPGQRQTLAAASHRLLATR